MNVPISETRAPLTACLGLRFASKSRSRLVMATSELKTIAIHISVYSHDADDFGQWSAWIGLDQIGGRGDRTGWRLLRCRNKTEAL